MNKLIPGTKYKYRSPIYSEGLYTQYTWIEDVILTKEEYDKTPLSKFYKYNLFISQMEKGLLRGSIRIIK